MANEDAPIRVVLVTAPNEAVGLSLAEQLVTEAFAACVNVLPGATSVYRWQGQLCRDSEVLLVIKTAVDRFDALCQRIQSIHPYELPEILSLPVAEGQPHYMEWVHQALQRPAPPAADAQPG